MAFPGVNLPPRLVEIAGEIKQAGGQAYLVGGWVRDGRVTVYSEPWRIV